MTKRKILKNYWKFYFFNTQQDFFCFDAFSHTILRLSEELYNLLITKKVSDIKRKYKHFYSLILTNQQFPIEVSNTTNCIVTLNFSNKCNLNCKYCYRKKDETFELSKSQIKEIFDYIAKQYYPKASQYIFSVCYTSESSFDLDKIKYIDKLIGHYEGYLFSEEQISTATAMELYSNLPKDLKEKYKNQNNIFSLLNKILIHEKLWTRFDYSKNDYLVKSLSYSHDLSYSKTIMANRQILNDAYDYLGIKKEIRYFSLSFMTNATNITQEYINFLKSSLIDTIYVSLDGPEQVHNSNRLYHDGHETYKDVIKGICILKENGINVIPSAVITPEYPDLNLIISHFIELGFTKISFNLVRKSIFSYESIDSLIKNINFLFNEFYENFKQKLPDPKLLIVKDTILFSYLKRLYYKNYVTTRCDWGKNLVIDSKGNFYHCNSTIGYHNDYLGNYKEGKQKKEIFKQLPNVDDENTCTKCYAKYLCGGTCYAEKIMKNSINQKVECYFHKKLIVETFYLYLRLNSNHLLDNFMQYIS